MKESISFKKIIVTVLIVVGVMFVFLKQGTDDKVEYKAPVKVVKVSLGTISDEVSFSGIAKPSKEVDISAKTQGRVSSLFVDIGDRVSSGDTIALLDGDTERVTVSTLEDNLLALRNTASYVDDVYNERIKASEESLSLVKKITSDSHKNVKAVSVITNTAILGGQVNDFLGELLSMKNGVRRYKSSSYYDNLGNVNFGTQSKAEESLMKYQALYKEYQDFFTTNILNKNPENDVVEKGLGMSSQMLENAKTALNDTYTMLKYTTTDSNLTTVMLTEYKTNTATFGQKAEELLATLYGVESEIKQTESNLVALKKEKSLKVSEIETQATTLSGQISVNKTLLDNSVLRSPFNGVVVSKNVEVGSVVGFGSPVYRVIDDSVLKVVIGVSDELSNSFHLGDKAFIYGDNKEDSIEANVTKIYPMKDSKSSKTMIELEVDNSEHIIIPGSVVAVSLSDKKSSPYTVSIPVNALISRYGVSYVFVVKDNTVTQKIVSLGVRNDSHVEILSGLSDGDIVVVEGGEYLRNGDKVNEVF